MRLCLLLLAALGLFSFSGRSSAEEPIGGEEPIVVPYPYPVPIPAPANLEINVNVRVYDNAIFAPIEGAVVTLKWDPITVGNSTTNAMGEAGFWRATYVRPANDATLKVYIDGVLVDTITFTQSTNGLRYLDYFIP